MKARLAILAVVLVCLCGRASADVDNTYTYTGMPYVKGRTAMVRIPLLSLVLM
jgi:hypothetical protein